MVVSLISAWKSRVTKSSERSSGANFLLMLKGDTQAIQSHKTTKVEERVLIRTAWRNVDETMMGVLRCLPVNNFFAVLRVGLWNAFSLSNNCRIKHGVNLLVYAQERSQRHFSERQTTLYICVLHIGDEYVDDKALRSWPVTLTRTGTTYTCC